MSNNYDIKISANLSERQENDNTIGNAGMLPIIDATGSYSHSSYTIKQKYSNGQEVNGDASASTSQVGNIGATWTIFDGLRMFRTKEKLSELSLMSQDQLKIQIENSLQSVIAAYYFIVRQQQLLVAINDELVLSQERIKIADLKLGAVGGHRDDELFLVLGVQGAIDEVHVYSSMG